MTESSGRQFPENLCCKPNSRCCVICFALWSMDCFGNMVQLTSIALHIYLVLLPQIDRETTDDRWNNEVSALLNPYLQLHVGCGCGARCMNTSWRTKQMLLNMDFVVINKSCKVLGSIPVINFKATRGTSWERGVSLWGVCHRSWWNCCTMKITHSRFINGDAETFK